jgi:hypothetical protein
MEVTRNPRAIAFLMLALAGFSTIAYAKPGISVKVHVEKDITALASHGTTSDVPGSPSHLISYVNVTVLPDVPTDKIQRNAHWCINAWLGPYQSVQLNLGQTYEGTFKDGFLYLEIPREDRKPQRITFTVVDLKWMKDD